ncbi:MAG: uracil phosphoribosyltransferase [Chloroflexi bacterium]|nr:MAG: uracil phosphoribosyltransferase [Chloroflexota bacterium]
MEESVAATPMAGRSQPARSDISAHPRLRIVTAPLLAGLLAKIRDRRTPASEFTQLIGIVGQFLILDACRAARMRAAQAEGFDGAPIAVEVLDERIAAVTVLRAGLAFAEPFRNLVPDGALYQVGAHRDEATLTASIYASNVPARPGWADRVLILDPMLATGGSVLATLERVRATFHGPIGVVALVSAPLGVQTVLSADANLEVITATLDERLDQNGYIRPGLGDAGDRVFGTFG